MNKYMTLCAIVLSVVFLAAPAGAQSGPKILYSRVPFPFVVNDTWLPAGNYAIRFDNHILNFRSEKLVAVFIGDSDDYAAMKELQLKFKLTNEGYRLCSVPGVFTNYCK